MNNINIIGRLTADVELKHTNNGKAVCSFCVAVKGVQDASYYIDCVAWEARAENISKYFHKGDKIGVAGMLTTRSYQANDGSNRKVTEVLVNSFDFCSDKRENTQTTLEPVNLPEPTPDNTQEITAGTLPFEI